MRSFNLKYSLKPVESVSSDALSNYAIFLLFAALLYQPFLCFINSHIFSVKPIFLMLAEAGLLSVVALNFLRGPVSIPMLSLFILVFANAFVLVLFQQYFDPKTIRNLMIPILLIWLGAQYNNKIDIDKLVKIFAWIVIVVGLFEFILPEVYSMVFNVINFHISIGRASERALQFAEGGFSLNGVRWGGRNLLPFLGDHRTSSVFLETVNMGNFGVLLACWGLSKKDIKSGFFFVAAAFVVAVLADSRFASTLIAMLLIMRIALPIKALEVSSYLSPLLILLVCFYFQGPMIDDNFKGRLGSTGYYILNFKVSEYFGLSNYHYSLFVDQGYAYLLHFTGLVLSLIMWISFCRLRMSSNEGRIFKSLVGLLIAANLAISGDSIFAFKWVSILWFLVGTMLVTSNSSIRNQTTKTFSA
jgi:putative polymerase